MIYIILFGVFLSIVFIASTLLYSILGPRLFLQHRLHEMDKAYNKTMVDEDERKLPFYSRVILPIHASIKRLIEKITPKGISSQVEHKLRLAGIPLSITGWFGLRIFFSMVLPILFAILIRISSMKISIKILLFSFVAVIGIIYPSIMLKERIKMRKKKMTGQLPDILDLLTVSVEAGLSFDMALQKVVEKGTGELNQEFGKVLNEIQLGKTRKDALADMAKRCDFNDLKVFIAAVIQGEQLGTSLGKVLRIQADQMRTKRRQRAQELAMKAPVKMLIPLVLFVFPSIFIVILGPAIIQIKEMFLKR